MKQFTVGKNKIVYVGNNFHVFFGDMKVNKSDEKMVFKKLEKSMNDKEILDELKPQECTLGDVLNAMKNDDVLKNGYVNIFYIKDSAGVLRAVGVYWDGGGWDVGTNSIESPGTWRDGGRVFSRNSFGTLPLSPSVPQTLGHSDPLTLALKTVIDAGYIVYKKID